MKQSTIRRAMLIALWTVVISSFVLSFAGVRELGVQAGYHPILAALLPLCLDGLVLAGSATILDAEMRSLSKKIGLDHHPRRRSGLSGSERGDGRIAGTDSPDCSCRSANCPRTGSRSMAEHHARRRPPEGR